MNYRTLARTLPRVTIAAALLTTLAACGGGQPTTVTVDESADVDSIDPVVEPVGDIAPLDEEIVPVTANEPDMMAAAPGEGWKALQGDWAGSVEAVQAHFGELSEEEVLATGGDREQLVMMVQEKYNLEPAEAEQQVNDFEAAL